MTQPRMPARARQNNTATGGRWSSKTVPTVADEHFELHNDAVGPANDWTRREVRVGNASVGFDRVVETGDDGNQVVTITADCEPADMLLLARKGDEAYWSGDNWRKHHKDRRTWSADIAVNMLHEGLVATGYGDVNTGLAAVMSGIGGTRRLTRRSPHALTAVVAQMRALRLIQSMVGLSFSWETKLGGHIIPHNTTNLLNTCFRDAAYVYERIQRPPWEPDDVPWGPQMVAGHATTVNGHDSFVGEHSDLVWRALTETDHVGLSPLKSGATGSVTTYVTRHLIAAAVLYDDEAAMQLTSDLFVGVEQRNRVAARDRTLRVLTNALNSNREPFRHDWNDEQQRRLRGFIETVEGLEP